MKRPLQSTQTDRGDARALTSTDSEIIAWLEQNHEDYQTATDATREEMRLGWQEMLDDMRGHTQTYWDEVERIIAQGDEAIIAFLKQHSADYQQAGKLQAEAYVDEWREKLEDLRAAYRQVSEEIRSYNYTPTPPLPAAAVRAVPGASPAARGSCATRRHIRQSAANGAVRSGDTLRKRRRVRRRSQRSIPFAARLAAAAPA